MKNIDKGYDIKRFHSINNALDKLREFLSDRSPEPVTLISVKPLNQNTIYDHYLTLRKNLK